MKPPADGSAEPAGAATAATASPHPTLRRLRRPSGEKPPLPHVIHPQALLLLLAAFVAAAVWILVGETAGQSSWLARFDAWVLRGLVDLRSGPVDDVAKLIRGVMVLPLPYVLSAVVIVLLLVTKRIRRLVVLAGALLLTMLVTIAVQHLLATPRPYAVEILGSWEGYGGFPVGQAYVTAVLVGVVLCLVPAGRSRTIAGAAVAVFLVVAALAGAILATDYPIAALVGIALAAAIAALVLWVFAPEASFPVVYGRRGTSAHLDLGGARGTAIRTALASQLGFEVLDIKPFGLSGSAGSSPMRVTVGGGPPSRLFAKLFAQQHVRADRTYKLMRTLLYGRLEDERPFVSVKRLAENEDYLMRVFADAGAPVVESYGIVELTPEREYLLVTGFAEGSREIGDTEAVVDDAIIDQGLHTIRAMWDAGLAHRDVKPANYLVRDGRLVMIDLGFAEIRPSPWRQAVDLANMMLLLALRTDAPRVYEAAQRYFTPDEIAEAFAASKGLTVPTQLQANLKADGRDLIAEFRALAPAHRPVAIQRWSVRRLTLAVGVAAGAVAVLLAGYLAFFGYDPAEVGVPRCPPNSSVLLLGQTQPAATLVPCLLAVPIEVTDASTTVDDDGGRVKATVPNATLTMSFEASCDLTGARRRTDLTPPDGADAVWELPPQEGSAATTLAIPVPNACVEVTQEPRRPDANVDDRVTLALVQLVPRSQLDDEVRRRTGGWADSLS